MTQRLVCGDSKTYVHHFYSLLHICMVAAIFESGTRLLFILLKPQHEVPFSGKLYMYAHLLVSTFTWTNFDQKIKSKK